MSKNTKLPSTCGMDSIRLLADQEVPVGTEVLIPKGIEWMSTHPTQGRGVTKRAMRIKVQTSSSRWTPDLNWAGTGGYWRWCPKVECFILSLANAKLNRRSDDGTNNKTL